MMMIVNYILSTVEIQNKLLNILEYYQIKKIQVQL